MGQWFWYNIVDRWEHRAKIKILSKCQEENL